MNRLDEVRRKNERFVIGLMSGTSVDAVDAALVKIKGNGTQTEISLEGFIEYPINEGIRNLILRNSINETSNVEELCKLNFILPRLYFKAIEELCENCKFELEKIDLIGMHGQTVYHSPNQEMIEEFNSSSTLQLGNPSVLAKLTGIITIGDFRSGDIALGGQGAPLVPYFDYMIFRNTELNRMLLNLGGIANITVLPANCEINEVFAFDTGPANMLMDQIAEILLGKSFDVEGKNASEGRFNEDLFNALIVRDNFIESKPPKSTGREYYGMNFLQPLLDEFGELPAGDWLNTLTHFTVHGIQRNYEKFVKPKVEIDELIVSGGGVKNLFLLKLIKEKFNRMQVKVIDEFGLSGDAKEAICFAVLANETISGNSANVPGATGASRSTLLGAICLP